jgi:transketolase
MSVSIGAALAKKLNNDPHMVYTLCGDGELQEGQNWEAIMYAASNQVDNLIVSIDYNGQQIDGSLDQVLSMGNIRAKFEAFGWLVIDVEQGNDIQSILNGLQTAKAHSGKGKPICVLLHTIMGNGVDFMMHTHDWHGKAPNDAQLATALEQNPETLGDY